MHIFRYLTGFGLTAAVFAIAITPAHACQGPQFEFHILSSHIPADTKNADFVGKVEIKLKRRWLLRLPGETYGYLANVLESSTHSDLVGGKIDLPPIIETSCGPFIRPGDQGFMTGKTMTGDGPYMTVMPNYYRGLDFFPLQSDN